MKSFVKNLLKIICKKVFKGLCTLGEAEPVLINPYYRMMSFPVFPYRPPMYDIENDENITGK